MRVRGPLLVRAACGDELQHRRIAGQRLHLRTVHAVCVVAIQRSDREAGGVEHHAHLVLRGQGLQQRQASWVLQRIHGHGHGVQALVVQCGQHGVKHCRVAGLQMGAVEHQQRGGGSVQPGLGHR